MDDDQYAELCETYTHPIPGTAPNQHNDMQRAICGGIVQEDSSRESLNARLLAAGAAAFPGARARDWNAVYIDPLRPRSARIDVPMSEHFKYAYDVNHRFIWEPASTAPLAYKDIELASLKNIAVLVLL